MPSGPLDFFEKFNFIVEIDGVKLAGFTSCSELSAEVGKIELREGGRAISHKKPGLQTFPDVTLTRGATLDSDLYTWFEQVTKLSTGTGEIADGYKREVDIVQIDRNGAERRRWTLNKAFPVKLVSGEWDATSEEAVMESVTLTFDNYQIAA